MIWQDIKSIYRSSWSFAVACPLLFLIPVIVEMAQHAAEVHLGMYVDIASAQAAENAPLRMQFALVKVIGLSLPGYWFTRYLAYGNDPDAARRIEPVGFALWGALFTANLAIQIYSLFGPPLGPLLGLEGPTGQRFGGVLSVASTLLGIYFTAWFVAWTLGDLRIGPLRSISIMHGHFWRAIAYLAAGVIPLMIVHYAFALGSIGRPEWLVWPMLIVDSIVVGFLALTMTAPGWFAAKRAADASGVQLPGGREGPGAVMTEPREA